MEPTEYIVANPEPENDGDDKSGKISRRKFLGGCILYPVAGAFAMMERIPLKYLRK